jgi:hypothetical protein
MCVAASSLRNSADRRSNGAMDIGSQYVPSRVSGYRYPCSIACWRAGCGRKSVSLLSRRCEPRASRDCFQQSRGDFSNCSSAWPIGCMNPLVFQNVVLWVWESASWRCSWTCLEASLTFIVTSAHRPQPQPAATAAGDDKERRPSRARRSRRKTPNRTR